MGHALLDVKQIDENPDSYIQASGDVFSRFDTQSQDFGNISYGVRVDDHRYFVKTAGVPNSPLAGPSSPTHEQRIALLRNAVTVSRSLVHPALPNLLNIIESPTGPLLVYEWVPGELIRNGASGGPLQRFKILPIHRSQDAVNTIYDVLLQLAEVGWIVEDFYDGSVIYDFETSALHIVDLDHCHDGPFTNTMGRMFGSSRFMAPEEFERGARIDHRTTTFLMGRIASVFMSDNTLDRAPFRGTENQHEVVVKACQADPADRYQTEAEFLAAWRAAAT